MAVAGEDFVADADDVDEVAAEVVEVVVGSAAGGRSAGADGGVGFADALAFGVVNVAGEAAGGVGGGG